MGIDLCQTGGGTKMFKELVVLKIDAKDDSVSKKDICMKYKK